MRVKDVSNHPQHHPRRGEGRRWNSMDQTRIPRKWMNVGWFETGKSRHVWSKGGMPPDSNKDEIPMIGQDWRTL